MPLNPRPVHAAEHPRAAPGEMTHGFRAWSQHAGDPPRHAQAPRSPSPSPGIDLSHPLVKVAAVAFVGYTLGRLMHRRPREVPPPPPARSPYRPGATEPYRVQPVRDRSSIRYR